MTRRLFATVTVLAAGLAGPALAADLPLERPATFAARFTWTGCHVGGHVGGGFGSYDITDPAQLVQDALIAPRATGGATTAALRPNGVVIGGQAGCDYQLNSAIVLGIEGSASGTTMRGRTTVALPLGNPDTADVKVNPEFLSSVTGRVGYAFDNVLLYARGGVALTSNKYEVAGSFIGTPFSFTGYDNRLGWTAGGGVEWAFARHWSTSLEYDYYSFNRGNVLLSDGLNGVSGRVDVRQSVQVVKLGLNFHIWSAGL